MSAYTQQETQITDAEILKECLKEKGYGQVEHTAEPQPLVDFQGRQTKYLDKTGDKAEIIIRRKYVSGAANDIGFKKMADGTFAAVISQYDKGRHNAAWMDDLKKNYAEKKIRKVASVNGLTFLKREVTPSGGVKLQYVKN